MDPAKENDWAALPQVESHPWDPIIGERPAAYKAFCEYRDSPPDEQNPRTVAQKHYNCTTPTPAQMQRIHHWSSYYHWKARTIAWIQHQSEIEQAAIQKALEAERIAAARERLETGRLVVTKINERIKEFGKLENGDRGEPLPAGVLAALLKAGADLARIEDGLSTERIDQTMREITVKDLTDEELLRYIQE